MGNLKKKPSNEKTRMSGSNLSSIPTITNNSMEVCDQEFTVDSIENILSLEFWEMASNFLSGPPVATTQLQLLTQTIRFDYYHPSRSFVMILPEQICNLMPSKTRV